MDNMSFKVLIADDEPQIREILNVYFTKEGFQVVEAGDGKEAMEKISKERPDILLLDVMMPVMDGLEVCTQVRQKYDLPIIMLTAKGEDDDRILGLEKGADDYITKPFNTKEVVARVKAVLRRAGGFADLAGKVKLEYKNLILDSSKMEVVAFGEKVSLTTKEFELLWTLANEPGKVLSRNELLEKIWGYTYFGDTRTVDTHIKRIRQKLNIGKKKAPWDIVTVWGVGYKFEVQA
jgi:two-component system response regulator ResD